MTRSFLKGLRSREIVAHTVDGWSLRGVLTGVHTDCIVLDAAKSLGEEVTNLEGQVALPRTNLAWVQVL